MKCFYCDKEGVVGISDSIYWYTPYGALCKNCIDDAAKWLYAKKKGGL